MTNEQNIFLEGADAATKGGYTQVPNFVLKHPKLSPGAKITYATLLSFAWNNNYCFPGQERLAKDTGSGVRSVSRYLKELEEYGLVKIKRQGLNKPNLYYLYLKVKKSRSASKTT